MVLAGKKMVPHISMKCFPIRHSEMHHTAVRPVRPSVRFLTSLKHKIYNQNLLTAKTYGCETWKQSKSMENKSKIAQRIWKSMVRATQRDGKRSTRKRQNKP